jgi:hypothetical protein
MAEPGDSKGVKDLVDQALKLHPECVPALRLQARLFRLNGRDSEADAIEEQVRSRMNPPIASEAAFAGAVRLLGVGVEPRAASPGEAIRMSYYWRCPKRFPARDYCVFVHFLDAKGRIAFQDDHLFLVGEDVAGQAYDEVFVTERSFKIPPDTAAGEYSVGVGLYRVGVAGSRVRVSTELPHRGRRVILPVRLKVE